MRMDVLGWLLTLVVTGVGALVMLYCRWYFRGKTAGVGQFSAVLLGFAGAMYGLVLTDDIVVLVMLWEATSVLSYLLIGYYHSRSASRRAALQALLVTTLGGLVMLIGVVLLVVQAGTSSLSTILADPPTGAVVDIAVLLLLVGALSKSAIFPFHFWLPGAMAAPPRSVRTCTPLPWSRPASTWSPASPPASPIRRSGGPPSSPSVSSRCCSAGSRLCVSATSSASSPSAR